MDIESTFIASYNRVIGEGVGITERGRVFFDRFYENFLASSERIREKFEATDMERQVTVLQKGLYHLITFYLTKTDNQFLRDIATTHSKDYYGIDLDLYDLWLDALLATVEEMDPEYNGDLQLAWRIVMTPGILYMKHHHSSPPRANEAE